MLVRVRSSLIRVDWDVSRSAGPGYLGYGYYNNLLYINDQIAMMVLKNFNQASEFEFYYQQLNMIR